MASSTLMPAILTRACKFAQHPRETVFHYRDWVLRKDTQYVDLRARIRHVLDVMKWTPSQLSREVDAGSPGAVGNWLGRNRGMDASFAFKLQDKYRWNARWLLEGVLPRRLEVSDEEAETLYQQLLELPADRRKALALILGSH